MKIQFDVAMNKNTAYEQPLKVTSILLNLIRTKKNQLNIEFSPRELLRQSPKYSAHTHTYTLD